MWKPKPHVKTPIEEARTDVLAHMKTLTPTSPDYKEQAKVLKTLSEIEDESTPSKSYEMLKLWMPAIVSFGGIGIIVLVEMYGHPLTSKALNRTR